MPLRSAWALLGLPDKRQPGLTVFDKEPSSLGHAARSTDNSLEALSVPRASKSSTSPRDIPLEERSGSIGSRNLESFDASTDVAAAVGDRGNR